MDQLVILVHRLVGYESRPLSRATFFPLSWINQEKIAAFRRTLSESKSQTTLPNALASGPCRAKSRTRSNSRSTQVISLRAYISYLYKTCEVADVPCGRSGRPSIHSSFY